MNKKTKRTGRSRKNKTRKYYGGFNKVMNNNKNGVTDKNEETKGVLDIIGNKLSGYSGEALNYLKEKGLRLAGLQPIKEEESAINGSPKEVDKKMNELSDAASGIIADVKNVFDKGSAAIIGNINGVLESPKVGESVSAAAEETAAISEKLLENFNEKLSTPEMKEETKKALENVAQVSEIAIEALDKPLNKAIDQLNAAGTKAASGIASGVVKVGTDALEAVPGVGAVIGAFKIANDATKAAQNVVSAATDATSTVKELVHETGENIDESLEKLDEKKEDLEKATFKPEASLNQLNKVGGSITNRVNKSITEFENTNNVSSMYKNNKTKRKFLKNKAKSKRVRFAI